MKKVILFIALVLVFQGAKSQSLSVDISTQDFGFLLENSASLLDCDAGVCTIQQQIQSENQKSQAQRHQIRQETQNKVSQANACNCLTGFYVEWSDNVRELYVAFPDEEIDNPGFIIVDKLEFVE